VSNLCSSPYHQQQTRFETMSESILKRIDEMGSRIDDLDKSISDLMHQANLQQPNGTAPTTTTTTNTADSNSQQQ
ncbi:hypothetical protein SAMD00019534_091200, partial [Acytostelium subglobosum LB1]|uniref:hypothetical protein n=1 Tax=Acytostelium subglobosum LB1 TaxID=1410327 RepID=UPI000644CDDC